MATDNDVSSIPEAESAALEGASISERFRVEGDDNRKCLNVTPVLVDFRRVLQQQKSSKNPQSSQSLIPGIDNRSLLHAVVGLYDTNLSELTPDVLYSTVCDKNARTIVLIRDIKDVFLEFELRRDKKKPTSSSQTSAALSGSMAVNIESLTGQDDKYKPQEYPPAVFAGCYSDTESENDNSDDEDDEDFSVGMNSYISSANARRDQRLQHSGPFTVSHIGPENRIIAACTFDRKYIKTGEKIIHLTLIAIRKRFRKLGLGKFLLQKVKDSSVVGPHDAVVVHAETEAASFFARYGFSDDIILNNRWIEIAEQFTNCTLMCYIPPYSGQAIADRVTDFDLLALDQDLRKWKDKSIEAYQAQVTIIERMKAEMIRLRSMVTAQDDIIHSLKSKLHSLETHKFKIDRELMMYKLKSISFSVNEVDEGGDTMVEDLETRYQVSSNRTLPDTTDMSGMEFAPPISPLLQVSTDLELRRYIVVPKKSGEVYDHGKDVAEFHQICEDFKSSLKKDPKIQGSYTVTSVSKALLNQNAVERYANTLRSIGDTAHVLKMYFCGPLEQPERLKDVLKNGFSDQDFIDGDYGKGLYFSRYASTAVHFSTPNKVLVAEVIVGKCQHLVSREKGRRFPDNGYSSVLCPGRLLATCGDGSVLQEYVIYNPSQALPLDLIEFTVASAATDVSSSKFGYTD